MVIIESTQLRQDPVYVSIYVFWSKFIMIEIIPYFSIFIMNIIIAIKLSQSSQFRKRFLSRRRKRKPEIKNANNDEMLNIMEPDQIDMNDFKNRIRCFLKDQQQQTRYEIDENNILKLKSTYDNCYLF